MKTRSPIYLNIGTRAVQCKEVVNLGLFEGADLRVDIRDGLPLADASISGIHCESHVELLDRGEILAFLRECRRVLVPDGILRIATFDLDDIVEQYSGFGWREESPVRAACPWIPNRASFLNHWHSALGCRWLVNEDELRQLGKEAGLADPRVRGIEESGDSRLETIGTRQDASLVMEFSRCVPALAESPLVSIVIPAYKTKHFRESLASAVRQTHRNVEILVLDDSPGDTVEEITHDFASRDPRVRHIRNEPPLGEIGNLTKAIVLARGEFIKPLYDDDILLPEATASLLALYRSVPDARLAAGRRVFIDTEGNTLEEQPAAPPLLENPGRISGPRVIVEVSRSGVNSIGEPTVVMFRRQDALAIDEPNVMSLFGKECMGIGDLALFAHLLSMGDLAYTTETISHFRLHPEQTQHREDVKARIESVWAHFRDCVLRMGFVPPSAQDGIRRQLRAAIVDREDETGTEPGAAAGKAGPVRDITDRRAYNAWLHKRECTPDDIRVLAQEADRRFADVSFLVFVRVMPEQRSALADTLDSFNRQLLPNWRVHVVSPLPAPEGLDDVTCMAWHSVPEAGTKALIDAVADAAPQPWIVELPAGVFLDPLCLWRIACESQIHPEAIACFVDDDVYDNEGARKKPRFKPGVNPSWLASSDLAGPLFVRRDIWRAAGGAAASRGSPWFDQLLRIVDSHGWQRIRHIPDVLLSYASQFPTDIEPCLQALANHFQRRNRPFRFEFVSRLSWYAKQEAEHSPPVTIAVFSDGQFDLLVQCVNSIIEKTERPRFDLILSVPRVPNDIELDAWLDQCAAASGGAIRVVRHAPESGFAERCNTVLPSAGSAHVLCIDEACVVIDANWLQRMVGAMDAEAAAMVTPRLVTGGDVQLESAGEVFGLKGMTGTPYYRTADLRDAGYLDCLQVRRDVGIAAHHCFLVSRESFVGLGGMEARLASSRLAVADFCRRLSGIGARALYEPNAVLVDTACERIDSFVAAQETLRSSAASADSEAVFSARWLTRGATDPFWNPNLSLAQTKPSLELDYLAQWQHQPTSAPRILGRPLTNGQGDFRITHYLTAARNAGLASECVWPQEGEREPTTAEISRLAPDSIVVHHYILDRHLRALDAWNATRDRPFIVFAMDDLLTNMDLTNPFRKGHAPNNRSRIKFALERCDRMVVSTEFLADCFSNLIADIRIVPNRLSMHTWLPLLSRKRTGAKPRIGWAGGTTHQGDLILIREVIEQTRDEADWVFMGMCPPEIKPLLSEYHPFIPMTEYPAYLASLNLDIAVAPLALSPFNQAKSNLRLLEYGILGIPVVCTDIDPYRNSPACRVGNTAAEWIDALRARIHDPDAREAEGRAMRHWVHQHFILENHVNQWVDAHLASR